MHMLLVKLAVSTAFSLSGSMTVGILCSRPDFILLNGLSIFCRYDFISLGHLLQRRGESSTHRGAKSRQQGYEAQ